MYVDGYIDRKKEVLHVVERINGRRILVQHQPVYEFYVESPNGNVKTINGTFAQKYEYNKSFEMRQAIDMYKAQGMKIYESDCQVMFKSLAKYYMGDSSPDVHKVFFDIETDFDKKRGFAPPDDPFNRITAISVYQSWTDQAYVIVLPPDDMNVYDAQDIINQVQQEHSEDKIILFTDEKDMIQFFFELIEDADILSGWNSEFFDIPYMVNRVRKIFSDAMTTRFCLWGKKPQPREVDNYGKTMITYDLSGKVHLDYLALYKKHASQVKQSYKLDDIGYEEVKENKIPYEGSLDNLYHSNFKRFIEYSLQDTVLLKKIDNKLDYISLHNRLAHQECVLISTTMGSVALIDTAIINLTHKRGEVVFDKRPQEDSQDAEDYDFDDDPDSDADEEDAIDKAMRAAKAAGAWVQDPVQGLVDFLGCVDFNSLYPSVLRALGMSTECILGQIRAIYTDAYLEQRIQEQRAKSKSKNFKPDWTEAWHGLFATLEFTKVIEKSTDVLTVDLEDGQTFTCTGSELYDMIYGENSGIVLSANGTLFDKNKAGVIPEILTLWYTERKAMQKAKNDFKHFYSDGLRLNDADDINIDIEELRKFITTNGTGKLRRTNIDSECPAFALRAALKKNNLQLAGQLISDHFELQDNVIKCVQEDMKYCKDQSAFWDQNQLIRKILLNSLYGALLNKGSRFYDKRLGQSVTLTGRTMAKHLASKINEVCGEEYTHTGGAVVYGDTDSVYFSVAQLMKIRGIPFDLNKDQVVELYQGIGKMVGDSFPSFMNDTFNTGMEKGSIIGADLEMVGSRGLFLKKKRYAILKYWDDGFRVDTDGKPGKIKAMGLEIKRSDTAKYIQVFLEDTLVSLLAGATEKELKDKVREFKKQFRSMDAVDKGSPKTVKKLTKWTEEYNDTGKCGVGHVLAAIQWNKLRSVHDDKLVPEATDGTKVMVCNLKNNIYGIKSIGYPVECREYLPEWFKELPFDEAEMEQKVLIKKMENIFGILDMDIGIHETESMANCSMFDFD